MEVANCVICLSTRCGRSPLVTFDSSSLVDEGVPLINLCLWSPSFSSSLSDPSPSKASERASRLEESTRCRREFSDDALDRNDGGGDDGIGDVGSSISASATYTYISVSLYLFVVRNSNIPFHIFDYS